MPTPPTKNFILDKDLNEKKIIDEISKSYDCVKESSKQINQTYFDTFDWRLFQKKYVLSRENNSYFLSSWDSNKEILKESFSTKEKLKFWWEFPEGELQSKLKSILDVRALLELTTTHIKQQTIKVLNEDRKTVLRMQFKIIKIKNEQKTYTTQQYLSFFPLKGYDPEYERCLKTVFKFNLTPATKSIPEFAMENSGRKPGDYSSKIDIELDPHDIAVESVKTILRQLFNTMRKNEAGIISDIDSEFLHDFRVAVRRTRAALTQIKGIFPPQIVNQFKKDFKYLGKLTNQLRDLDVYLLKKEYYKNILPEEFRKNLSPFFAEIESQRKKEYRKLVNFLKSEKYFKITNSWETFLNPTEESGRPATDNSQKPIINLAKNYIYKQYRKVIKIGKKVSPESPDEDLHRLRIECKKLRYLLEFFSSLFHKKKITGLIKRLKKLQDNLGDFNDLFIQQVKLKSLLENSKQKQVDPRFAAAIGGLITSLNQKQHETRQEFSTTFKEFANIKNESLFKMLFA